MAESSETADRARRAAIQRLESLQRAGVMQLGKPRKSPVDTTHLSEQPEIETQAQSAPRAQSSLFDDGGPTTGSSGWKAATMSHDERTTQLEVVSREVAACTLCAELASSRTQTVFGVGHPQARLCFLGEAPGADEDRQGEPFVGRAGQLLTDIIEKAMGLKRDDVYILNILKCRPPGNRNPTTGEAENCRPFLDRQLEIIQPEFICCLGSIAVTNLLGTTQSIGRLRGKWHTYRGARVLATYHPAYLLRNPSAKKQVWEDIKLLMAEMGLEPPSRTR